MELQPLPAEVVATVTSIQGTDMGLLLLYNREPDDLYVRASVGSSPEALQMLGRVPRGTDTCWSAICTRERVMVEDIADTSLEILSGDWPKVAGFRALYSMPMFSRGRVTGVCGEAARAPGPGWYQAPR